MALTCLGSLVALPAATATGQERARFDTKLFAKIPAPGFPASAYLHPDSRVYEGTYDNPAGDPRPSRVFEFTNRGSLTRSWTIGGQTLDGPHGVQVAASDADGDLVLLDKSPARVLKLDRATGVQSIYATFPEAALPNFAAWGPDGSLYLSDYAHAVLWRVPPGGGVAIPWLRSPVLEGGGFGATGLRLLADQRTLLVAMQSQGGGTNGNPTTGRLYKVAINPDGSAGAPVQFWESGPLEGPDGFAVATSGNVYITLLLTNQLAVVSPQGQTVERFPSAPLSGENGGPVPFDGPSNAVFDGQRLLVAQQSFLAGTAANQVIQDVFVGETGLPELVPPASADDPPVPEPEPLEICRTRRTITLPRLPEGVRYRSAAAKVPGDRVRKVTLRGGRSRKATVDVSKAKDARIRVTVRVRRTDRRTRTFSRVLRVCS
ncbi:MAG: hypothetical protein H0V81_09875 [Solirubrobacterales bacterium]|nr:hypothetical protein [Solirubrobacterales bacterium]